MSITLNEIEMKRKITVIVIALVAAFSFTACGTLSEMARNGVVGYGAGSAGYTYLGVRSSESECRDLASSKGYSYYIYDSVTGACYGK